MTRVLVTGPESSGTRWLTALISDAGADALHRSQPEGVDWIDMAAMVDDFDHVVVIIRGLLAHLRSQILPEHSIEPDEQSATRRRRKALARLAPILGHPKVTVVTYESMRHRAEVVYLLRTLGLDETAVYRRPWTDQNPKHYDGGVP